MAGFRTILVPTDFSGHSGAAIDAAVELAKAFGGKIRLLHCYALNPGGVSPYGVVIPPNFDREVREAAARQLDELRDKTAARGVEVEATLSSMFPSQEIVRTAEEIGADVIVMGTRGLTGVKHVLLGSVTERTVRMANCPVLTVKADDEG